MQGKRAFGASAIPLILECSRQGKPGEELWQKAEAKRPGILRRQDGKEERFHGRGKKGREEKAS